MKKILGVIGGGFMAHAIVAGAIGQRFLKAEQIFVSEPDAERRRGFELLGVEAEDNNRKAAACSDYLLVSVKPQVFPSVAAALQGERIPVVISIMAGKTKTSVACALSADKVARVMPNLPCSVGAGMAGIDSSGLSAAEKEFVFGLFSSVGEALEVDESLLNAVTGVSGSGPAYVYLFLRSLISAGVAQGLSESQARTLALQTVEGGVRMAKTSGRTLDELIGAVSSKGGTTVAALDSFAYDDFEGSVIRAVDAAVRRAEELSE